MSTDASVVVYTYKQDLGSYSSSLIFREINTNFPNQCFSIKSTKTQKTQQLIVKVDCSNPNEPKQLNHLNIKVPIDSLELGCSKCESKENNFIDLNVLIVDNKVSKVGCITQK